MVLRSQLTLIDPVKLIITKSKYFGTIVNNKISNQFHRAYTMANGSKPTLTKVYS